LALDLESPRRLDLEDTLKLTFRYPAQLLSIAALILIGALGGRPTRAVQVSDAAIFKPADFEIYDAHGKQLIGHASYRAQEINGGEIIKGQYRYFDGQWDVEEERLEHGESGAIPQMMEFNHTFYAADGTMQRRNTVDLKTGNSSCEVYNDRSVPESNEIHAANLSFPADTFAGASLLIPLETGLRNLSDERLKFHVFTCVPEPRVIAIDTPVDRAVTKWPLYAGGVAVRVDVQPDLGLGLFNLIAAPFLPKISAWFDPSRDWDYAGGSSLRFYRGPRITLVRDITGNMPAVDETIRAEAGVKALPEKSKK
jgi:hypothetical protein